MIILFLRVMPYALLTLNVYNLPLEWQIHIRTDATYSEQMIVLLTLIGT